MKKLYTKIATPVVVGAMMFSLVGCSTEASSETEQTTTTAEEEVIAESGEDGGYEINSGSIALDDNADAKAAFEKALEGLDGSDYEPVALLGTQVVSGTNYAILCRMTPVVEDAEPSFVILYIYEDLDGNAEISEIADLEI